MVFAPLPSFKSLGCLPGELSGLLRSVHVHGLRRDEVLLLKDSRRPPDRTEPVRQVGQGVVSPRWWNVEEGEGGLTKQEEQRVTDTTANGYLTSSIHTAAAELGRQDLLSRALKQSGETVWDSGCVGFSQQPEIATWCCMIPCVCRPFR